MCRTIDQNTINIARVCIFVMPWSECDVIDINMDPTQES